MELKYTTDGPYKVMAAHGDLTVIFNRFNTLSEALYVLDYHTGPSSDNIASVINKNWDFWLEV
jgi:hypothetical protein